MIPVASASGAECSGPIQALKTFGQIFGGV
jgi:hypothetical protein